MDCKRWNFIVSWETSLWFKFFYGDIFVGYFSNFSKPEIYRERQRKAKEGLGNLVKCGRAQTHSQNCHLVPLLLGNTAAGILPACKSSTDHNLDGKSRSTVSSAGGLCCRYATDSNLLTNPTWVLCSWTTSKGRRRFLPPGWTRKPSLKGAMHLLVARKQSLKETWLPRSRNCHWLFFVLKHMLSFLWLSVDAHRRWKL